MTLFIMAYFVYFCLSCLNVFKYPLYLVCKGDYMLKMDLEYINKILFVRLNGRLLRKNCYKINNYLNPVLRKHQIKWLVYNFSNLKEVDNSGIDAILESKYIIKENRGKIRMCNASKGVKEKIKLVSIANEEVAFKLVGEAHG